MPEQRNESSAATPYDDPQEMLRALTRTVSDEADTLRALVRDENSDCLVRDLRAERLAAMEWVLRVFRQAERWEW
jgi:hypothetical protein